MANTFLLVKLFSIVVAIITTTLGCYSHYGSTWTKKIEINLGGVTYQMKMADLCDEDIDWDGKNCPTLFWETFFITIVIINLVGSLISAVLTFIGRTECSIVAQGIDVIFHTVRCIFLLLGGPFFIWSAVQIKDLLGTDEEFNKKVPGLNAHFRYTEKIAAGSAAIFQGFLYAFIVFLAYRNRMRFPTKVWVTETIDDKIYKKLFSKKEKTVG